MNLSVIIPAHNEEENILDVIKRIEDTLTIEHELIIVNDHSQDNTFGLVERVLCAYPNIRLVENKREKGFANAIRTGFDNASGDIYLPVMADLCDDLETINRMYKKVCDGYDVVCGSRYIKGGKRLGGSRLKALLSSFGGSSLGFLLSIPTHDIANAFKMYRSEVIKNIEISSKGFEISMEIPLKAYYAGFRITEVPTVWKERTKGKSTFKVFKLLPSYIKLYTWAILKKMSAKK
jgi:glycosyltransferase involved in cell wall biosynthesis